MIEPRGTPLPPNGQPTERLSGCTLEVILRRALLNCDDPVVLAVSGGRDSMAMMHAFAQWAPERVAAVATFDHATGGYATEAASVVVAEGRKLGFAVVRERATTAGTNEAAWRAARWRFLRRVARAYGARVATAHTQDDQLETVVMRLLRGAGTRGLAALAATSPVLRPWLAATRADVANWAARQQLRIVDDPTNVSSRFLRSRVRHDLLPALEQARPGFGAAMLSLGERAAAWRCEVDAYLDRCGLTDLGVQGLQVPAAVVQSTSDAGRAVLWQALFSRVGVALDARGTRALIRFTNSERRGAFVSLAGGAVAVHYGVGGAEWFELRARAPVPSGAEWQGEWGRLPLRFGRWRWRRFTTASADDMANPACFAMPASASVCVRPWQAGDRIRTLGAPAGRRVARYFSDAHVPSLDRQGWPVVLDADAMMLWVPGICRGLAAPHWPGRPDLIWYRCERQHD